MNDITKYYIAVIFYSSLFGYLFYTMNVFLGIFVFIFLLFLGKIILTNERSN